MIYITSWFLSMVLSSLIMKIYGYAPLSFPVIAIGVQVALLQLLCHYAEKHHLSGGILITAYYAALFYVLAWTQRAGYSVCNVEFRQWALTAADEVGNVSWYVATLAVGLPAVFGVFVYYFVVVRYRVSFLSILSLLPCVVYAKIMADVDNLYVVLIAGSNIATYIASRWSEVEWMERTDEKKKVLIDGPVSSAAFILLVMFLVSFIPKIEETPYYDRFESMFLGEDTKSEAANTSPELSDESGNADNWNDSNRRLYTIWGDGITYLKKQNFDYYDFEKDSWTKSPYSETGYMDPNEFREKHEGLQLTGLAKAMEVAGDLSPEFKETYGSDRFSALSSMEDPMRHITVSSVNFGAVYYLSAARVVSVGASETGYSATVNGCFSRETGPHRNNFQYQVSFYDEFAAKTMWLSSGASNYTIDESISMLEDAERILIEGNKAVLLKYVEAFLRQARLARAYHDGMEENTALISEELRLLAADITKDCTYDWEKAAAIQNFFHKGDFSYDLKYRAPDNSPEYFLFEGKVGTCSDYASAFVLLARAAGLTVRYAEGYVPELASWEEVYYVSESGSHAYPEVYLPGYGWTVYEPTVASDMDFSEKTTLLTLLRNVRMDYGLIAVIAIGMIFLGFVAGFIRLLVPLLLESYFRIKLTQRLKTDAGYAMQMAYERLLPYASAKWHIKADALTPAEFADRLMERGLDAREEILLLERTAYRTGKKDEVSGNADSAFYKKAHKAIGKKLKVNPEDKQKVTQESTQK